MNKLRTRFGLALSAVLLAATLLPILLLYGLSASGLVEATYISASQDARLLNEPPMRLPVVTPPATPPLRNPPIMDETQGDEKARFIPFFDPETGQRFPYILFDSETGQLTAQIPSDLQRVVLSSPVFKFRVDVPAWFVLGSLPMVSLVFGIFMSIWMSRSVTRPISRLAQAAQAIGRHNLSYRVETGGSQELQDLAQSFNRMAEQLERVENTRRNLMADVAHELRTPLSVLDGNLRAMLDGVHEISEEEIALLYEQTHHLNRLVDDLRELSLAEAAQLSLNLQEVDLTRLINETVMHFDLIAQEQGVQLSTELEDALVHASLDQNRIRQVLHNLISNAFHHTPQGGKVVITGKRFAKDNAVKITITDTGTGISPEALPHIFDRFYRADEMPDQVGTGLGLAIVKAIVEAHGGHVSAASDGINQGSSFSIVFPNPAFDGREPTV